MATKQETFDTVVAHLRKQGRQSLDSRNSMCMYRGEDGTKCAIGVLIPDEQYDPDLESQFIPSLDMCHYKNEKRLLEIVISGGHDPDLAKDLQEFTMHLCLIGSGDLHRWQKITDFHSHH